MPAATAWWTDEAVVGEHAVVAFGDPDDGRIRAAEDDVAAHADVLGPHPCALSRIRGRYRFDLLVRTENALALRELLGTLDNSGALRTKAESTIIDVDPVTLT